MILLISTYILCAHCYARETVTIGIPHHIPPFVMKTASSEFYGFDIAVMEHLCKTTNLDCRYKQMNFRQLLPTLFKNEIDIAIGSIIITKSRKAQIAFTLPYMISEAHFIARYQPHLETNPNIFIKNRKVGYIKGTVFQNYLYLSTLKTDKLIAFDRLKYLIDALSKGSIDYALLDRPIAGYWQIQSRGKFVVVGKSIPLGLGIGIAISKKKLALIPVFNKEILAMRQNGLFSKLYHSYFRSIPQKPTIKNDTNAQSHH